MNFGNSSHTVNKKETYIQILYRNVSLRVNSSSLTVPDDTHINILISVARDMYTGCKHPNSLCFDMGLHQFTRKINMGNLSTSVSKATRPHEF